MEKINFLVKINFFLQKRFNVYDTLFNYISINYTYVHCKKYIFLITCVIQMTLLIKTVINKKTLILEIYFKIL